VLQVIRKKIPGPHASGGFEKEFLGHMLQVVSKKKSLVPRVQVTGKGIAWDKSSR
jgi:hypothetical protein